MLDHINHHDDLITELDLLYERVSSLVDKNTSLKDELIALKDILEKIQSENTMMRHKLQLVGTRVEQMVSKMSHCIPEEV